MFNRTERLFLRPVWPEDAEAIFNGIADQEIVNNLATAPWPYTRDDARYFAALEHDPRFPKFMVTLPEEGIIGSAGMGIDGETGDVQLGYWIGRKWWGQGFATEATKAVLKVAKAIGYNRITASHFVDNPASGRVLKKAGFQPTGLIRPGHSLARGRSDPVACFMATLDTDDDDGRGGEPNDEPNDDLADMLKAA